MRRALFLAVTVVAASGAQAQSFSQRGAAQAAREQQISVGDARDGPAFRSSSFASNDTPRSARMTCLIRKADHQRVCHSYREWREIALRMDEGAAAKP